MYLTSFHELIRSAHRPLSLDNQCSNKQAARAAFNLTESAVFPIPHQVLYLTLALVYVSACFGVAEGVVYALLAIGHTVLAFSKH